MHLSTGIDLDCPPEEAFAWVDDPERAMKWQTSVTGGVVVGETEGRVGTTFRETVGGRGSELSGEITEYVPGSIIAFRITSDYTVADVTWQVRARGVGSRLDVDATVRFRSVLRYLEPLLGPVFRWTIHRELDGDLRRLNRLCGRGPETADEGARADARGGE